MKDIRGGPLCRGVGLIDKNRREWGFQMRDEGQRWVAWILKEEKVHDDGWIWEI